MNAEELAAKWPEKPSCTRDRLLYLLDVYRELGDEVVAVKQIDELVIAMPGVRQPVVELTVGDLRILADVAVGHQYDLDGETGSEIEVEQG